jgi:sulfite oxidase
VTSPSRAAGQTHSAMPSMPRRLNYDADGLNTACWPPTGDQLITPVDQFFTRSHAQVPRIDPGTWRVDVGGLVQGPRSFSLEELQYDFLQRDVTATLVCAGLRRNEFLTLGPLPGELPWGPEPASTGRWTGVSLADLLNRVGVRRRAHHVEFVGMDRVERHGHRFGFGGSIDLTKALDGEVLLATALNGKPLPPAHGFPVRVVVPGWIGARSVKWLERVILREDPSANYFQTNAYRLQREVHPHDPRDVSAGAALTEIFLNSVIISPTAGQAVPPGQVKVNGWAIGSGGCALTSVEVSVDAGNHWTEARIIGTSGGRSWSHWEVELNLPRGRHTLVVRAADITGVSQPMNVEATWNVKGYNNNAWHRVTVDLA